MPQSSSDISLMQISVLIPTHRRPDKLRACLEGLAAQTLPKSSFEVLVGIDGPDHGEQRVAAVTLGSAPGGGVRFGCFALPKRGPAATRNAIFARAAAPLVLLLNDDVRPAPDLLERHVEAHRTLAGRPAMILGAAPWVIHQPDRLFDRLVRDTSLIFFYDQMTGPRAADAGHDWGFRHAWTLNLSLPAEAWRAAGGFCEDLPRAVYEDLEFAYRVRRATGAPVHYRPAALVEHDHRYEPSALLERDVVLGYEALNLARRAPQCAAEMFRRDLTTPQEAEFARAFIERESRAARRNIDLFISTAEIPAFAIDGAFDRELLRLIYEQSVLARRWLFAAGFVAARDGAPIADALEFVGFARAGASTPAQAKPGGGSAAREQALAARG